MARERPDKDDTQASQESTVPFRQALSRVARNKTVWLFGLVLLGQVGAIQGLVGYLPWYLKEYKSWSGTQADGILAAFNLTSTIFTIPLALLSDRLGSRRAILIPAMLVTVIGIGLLSVVNGALPESNLNLCGRKGFRKFIPTRSWRPVLKWEIQKQEL